MKNTQNIGSSFTSKSADKSDPIFAEYGDPFITKGDGKVKLNERAVAAKCATKHQLTYNAKLNQYEQFDKAKGLWAIVHEADVRRLLGDLLLELGEEWGQEEFVHINTNSHFSSLGRMLQPYGFTVATVQDEGLLHVLNGVLDLNVTNPKLMPHDPKYSFHHGSPVKYDRKGTCSRFVKHFLRQALADDDIALVQKYCGSMLLGSNSCHGILVIRGTPGGGKSTLVSIIEKVLAEEKVAQLRTTHLTGRFETSTFIGKRVLVGKDVPGDTLNERGARLLKALVGGDLLEAEIKYNPKKQKIRGNYHIVIVSNSKLRVALDGDDDAWRRRLLLVDFENKKPTKPIADLADKLVSEEGSGILNWLIAGAAAYRKDMDKHGALLLSEAQEQRIALLLHDSDSVLSYLEQRVEKSEGLDVASQELLVDYFKLCNANAWTPVSGHKFQTRVPDLMCQHFQICRRNDVLREGKAVRGYKGIALKKE
jgi:putative DNA primase/helicase